MPETEYTSLGGYLYSLCENLPEINQELDVVTVDEQLDDHADVVKKTVKLRFIITAVEDRSIEKVKLIVEPTTDTPATKSLRDVIKHKDHKDEENNNDDKKSE